MSLSKRSLIALFTIVTSAASAAVSATDLRLNMTEGVTSISHEVYGLHMLIFYICCAIGVLVFGVMFFSIFFHRKSRGHKASHFHESLVVEILWTVVPILILIAMAIPATATLKKMYDADDADLDVMITGYQWKWKYEYPSAGVSFFSNLSTPQDIIHGNGKKDENYLREVDNPLVLPVGEKIRFLVTANDVIHSWWVPDFAVKRDAIPGYFHAAWAKVDKVGTYRGQCAELCGKDHGFMPIVVKVVEPAEFQAWLAKKREEAKAVEEAAKQTLTLDQLLDKGQEVYTSRCVACHGANGEGGVGKPIKGSKIATGPVANHIATVLHGVNGTAMQAFAEQLTPVEAAAVITFERNAFGNNTGDIIQPLDIVNFKQGQ